MADQHGLLADLDRCRAQHEAVVEQLNECFLKRGEIRERIHAALDELGVPDENYPAPVANAVRILREALG